MKLNVKIQLLNFCFQVLNFIFLALGLSVFGSGLWILFDRGSLQTVLPSVEMRTVGAGLMLIGAVVLLVTLVGILGAEKQIRVVLLLYVGFLIVLILGQLFITVLLLISRDKIERSLDQMVDQFIVQFGADSSEDRLMDRVQKYESCCGRTGPADWLNNSFIQSLNLTNPDVLPCSCFKMYEPSVNSFWCSELGNYTGPLFNWGNSSYDTGCKEKVSDWLKENTLTVVSMEVGLMLIEGLQLVLAVQLYSAFGRKSAARKRAALAGGADDHGEQNYAYSDPQDGYADPAHPAHHHDYQN
ncbi:CD82 antigen [Sander vitreus]